MLSLLAQWPAAVGAQDPSPQPSVETQTSAETPGPAEIARALEIVKADPNLATERTVKSLRWKDSTPQKPSPTPAWLLWIAGLFGWFSESARLLMWCTIAVLAGML